MKILQWEGDGFSIWFKRLESGTFRFPTVTGESKSIEITRSGLAMILEGIERQEMVSLCKLPKLSKRRTRDCFRLL